jgi:transposase
MLNVGMWGKLIKILWHDGLGMSLYAKRLERGRFLSCSC